MAENHELAKHDYILGAKYAEIAEKYNVSINTVKSWKKRYGWSREKTAKKSAPIAPIKKKKGCTTKNKDEPIEELSNQEQLFCYHYVRTWNATQAALLAGYAKESKNKHSAQVLGSRLLQRPRVKYEVDRLRELFKQEIHVDIQDFLAFCMKVIGADIGDYIRFGQKKVPMIGMYGPIIDKKTEKSLTQIVNYVSLCESEQVDTSIIAEIREGKDGVSIKLADKKWAWEQLIKYFDWLPDKWQRKVEGEKLELERKRVSILEHKAGDADDADNGGEDNFKEALMGKVPEVWGNDS